MVPDSRAWWRELQELTSPHFLHLPPLASFSSPQVGEGPGGVRRATPPLSFRDGTELQVAIREAWLASVK